MTVGLRTRLGQFAAYAAGLVVAAFWVTAAAPQNWGVPVPDDVHTYGIRLRRGADLFFRPSVGWFIDNGLWVCLALAVAAVLAEFLGRRVAIRFVSPETTSPD